MVSEIKGKIVLSWKWMAVYIMMIILIIIAGFYFYTDSTELRLTKKWHDEAQESRARLERKLDSVLMEIRKHPATIIPMIEP